MTVLDHPDRAVPKATFARASAAAVSYLPGHEFAEVEIAMHGRRIDCTATEARDLAALLLRMVGAETADHDRHTAGRGKGEDDL